MNFSPLFISSLIIKPLRYFFENYGAEGLKYNSDATKSDLEIDSINNFHKEPIQVKPRIMVDRGTYAVTHVGLSDNLADGKSAAETLGLQHNINMVFIRGTAQIVIESLQEGVIEILTDMVSHFLVWTGPHLCNSQGFKIFAIPLQVSAPTFQKEDREVFRVTIDVPYCMEEQWRIRDDALKLNAYFLTLSRKED